MTDFLLQSLAESLTDEEGGKVTHAGRAAGEFER